MEFFSFLSAFNPFASRSIIGKTLKGRYLIEKQLGQGGYGTTYLAADLDVPDRRKCVVKQLTPSSRETGILPKAKQLFKQEAIMLQALGKNEQIPELLAYFEQQNQFYLVQEFIDGHNLSQEIYPGRIWNEKQTVHLLRQILQGLRVVHQTNVIHRDLKPSNLMRRKSDQKVMLIDFGAVKEIKELRRAAKGEVTSTVPMGTRGYMPMEQALGNPRFCSDIYAVGMIGIEALTGKRATQLQQDKKTGEILWNDRVKVSEQFVEILQKMVAQDANQRYHSVDEIMLVLEAIDSNWSEENIPKLSVTENPVHSLHIPKTREIAYPDTELVKEVPQLSSPKKRTINLRVAGIGLFVAAGVLYTIANQFAISYNIWGYIYEKQEKYEKAIDNYTQAIELDPNYAKAYKNRGDVYVEQDKYEEAIADFTEAIQIEPNFTKAYNNRGNVYNRQGKYEEAIVDYTQQTNPIYHPCEIAIAAQSDFILGKLGKS